MNLISAMLLVTASAQANAELATQKDAVLDGKVIDAVPLDRPAAIYPRLAAERGREGWVQLSYVVNEQGEVESAVIEKSSGEASFERSALKAVKQWQFKPALQNNKPIKQCKNQVQLMYHLPEPYRGVSRSFLTRYKKIVKRIDKNELESVPELFQEIEERKLKNFTEDSYYWVAKARYFAKKDERENELRAIVRIIQLDQGYIPDDMYIAYLTRAIVLNMEQSKLKYALSTFDRLSKISGAEASVEMLAPYIDKVHALIEDDSKTIWVNGKITKSLWSHQLVRNAFSISDIQGNLDTLEVRCDNQFSSYEVKTGLQWNIPKSWQGCQVYVYGEQGASFNLVETAAAKKV
ncbi:energy transducer TonB [Pseudoalteromonas luteoviolacea]|uniref:energy transducer TonB n=1 Tax=Pseudoalteromonas luteoviolacea TaxID=43657 RepID=UPI001B3A2463|nr:energy transducer TonB [Pseudoalteromonas luteoviolacea]MBQ4876619.1 energy transducer TonB [Pseudoalteromonas luteoviolacea]MBQ4905250.1 energy transducer TonB [Pseudoalteromonas luteoviolacea]